MQEIFFTIILKLLSGLIIIVVITLAAERKKTRAFEKFVKEENSRVLVNEKIDLYECFTIPQRLHGKSSNYVQRIKNKSSFAPKIVSKIDEYSAIRDSLTILEFIKAKNKDNEWLRREDWIDNLPIEDFQDVIYLDYKKQNYSSATDITGVTNRNLSGTTKNLYRGSVQDYSFSFKRNIGLGSTYLNPQEKRIFWNAAFKGYETFKKMHGRFPRTEEPYGSWAKKQRKAELDEIQIQKLLALNPYFFDRNKSEAMIDFLKKNYNSKFKKVKNIKQYFRRKYILGTLTQKEFENLLEIDDGFFFINTN